MSSDDDSSWRGRGQNLINRLVSASAAERIGISLAALAMAVIVGALIVLFAGWAASCTAPFLILPGIGEFCYNPIAVYWYLFWGAIAGPFYQAQMLTETTLLIFTGLSVAVAFRAGMFNIGTQGQFVLGALATAVALVWAAPHAPTGVLGTFILLPFGLLVGAVVGGAYGAIPGALKAYADANEVITTIMLNFIASGIAFVLVSEYLKDPGSQSVETRGLPAEATFQSVLYPGSQFSIFGLAFALALIAGIYLLLRRTSFGYDLRVSGTQPDAAEYGGVDAARMTVSSMTLSGALGGIGGAVYVTMVLGRWNAGIPPLGFDGIAVSILAGNNPLAVFPAAVLFGILKSGSLAIDVNPFINVPRQLVGMLRGLIILFVAMPEFFRMLGTRWNISTGDDVAADGGVENDS